MNKVLKIAHRSGPGLFPEQTVASARKALNDGADLIEIDVRFTKDNNLAVCHDENALRVFGVDREIDEMTVEEYLSLHHKDNPEYSAHILSDYLEAGIKPLLIHVKEDEVIFALIKELEKYNYTYDDVVFGVTAAAAVKAVRAEWENARVLAFLKNYDCKEEFIKEKVNYIRVWEKWLGKYDISFDFPTWVMTNKNGVGYTDKKEIEHLISCGASGILINDINLLQII